MSGTEEPAGSTRIPAWRFAAGMFVLGGLGWLGTLLVPVYVRNLELERFIHGTRLSSEEGLRRAILQQGRCLGLDVAPDQLEIWRVPGRDLMDVRYAVRVNLAPYTVSLHFTSSVGSGAKFLIPRTGDQVRNGP